MTQVIVQSANEIRVPWEQLYQRSLALRSLLTARILTCVIVKIGFGPNSLKHLKIVGNGVIHLFSSIDPLFLVLLAKFSG